MLAAATLFVGAYGNRPFWFAPSPTDAARQEYGGNPFPEMIEVAKYLKAHTNENDVIGILGSEPETFFYAHRRSATGMIYTYGLMEHQKYARQMLKDTIRDLETSRPKYMVFVRTPPSWLVRPDSDTTIFTWAKQYLGTHYDVVGMVEFLSTGDVLYLWDEDVKGYPPTDSGFIFVLKRKDLVEAD